MKKIGYLFVVSFFILLSGNATAGQGWYVTITNNLSPSIVKYKGLSDTYDGCWYPKDLGSPFQVQANSSKTYYTEEDRSLFKCAAPDQWSTIMSFTITGEDASQGDFQVVLVTPDDSGPAVDNKTSCGGPNGSYVGWNWTDEQSHPTPQTPVVSCGYNGSQLTLDIVIPNP